jgi:hypothetical protein
VLQVKMWRGFLNCLDFKQLAHGLHIGLPVRIGYGQSLAGPAFVSISSSGKNEVGATLAPPVSRIGELS